MHLEEIMTLGCSSVALVGRVSLDNLDIEIEWTTYTQNEARRELPMARGEYRT